MTRERLYGSDTPFCAWMRSHPELPSYSQTCGFVATDNDVTIHRYLTGLVDACGTRDIQSLMHLEVKTRGGLPTASQRDTLRKKHLFRGTKEYNGQVVRFWGCYVLSMSGLTPDDSQWLGWGRFSSEHTDQLTYTEIDRQALVELLKFERHPDNLDRQPFRRRHKTRFIDVTEEVPLGFTVERTICQRS